MCINRANSKPIEFAKDFDGGKALLLPWQQTC